MTRPWVKICGITNQEDALEAIRLGADALGFNLWSGSKRYVPFEENAKWIAALPGDVERIAVLVNSPLEQAFKVAEHPAFHAVQFHGSEDVQYVAEFSKAGRPFILAIRLGEDRERSFGGDLPKRLLIDAAVPGEFGGTGTRLDVKLAAQFVQECKSHQVILAGGLTPENVREAIEGVRPYGVDVASGVEATPRRKDWGKVGRFIAGAHFGGSTASQEREVTG